MADKEPAGCFAFGALPKPEDSAAEQSVPESVAVEWRKNNAFLSNAERSFYGVLLMAVGDYATVSVKVRMGDLIWVKGQANRNKIDRKHVDFVLLDPQTLDVFCCVELDDSSHEKAERIERDLLVDEIFKTAGIPLLHVKCERSYIVANVAQLVGPYIQKSLEAQQVQAPPKEETVSRQCPECGSDLVIKVAQKGPHAGKKFFACPKFPQCSGGKKNAKKQS